MEVIIKEAGVRLDKAVADLTDLSRSLANEQIKNGQILVNGQAKKAKYTVKEGDVISYELPEPEVVEYVAEDIPLEICQASMESSGQGLSTGLTRTLQGFS